MERLAYMAGVVSDPGAVMASLHEKGHGAWQLARSHPWITAGVVTGTAYLWSYLSAPRNLPPGPINYPLIGAISCIGQGLEKKMFNWRKRYGDVVSFYKSGRYFIVLNSERTIKEAFVKQGDDFSHRTTWGVSSCELFGNQSDEIFAAPFNEQWKKNKKFAVSSLKNFGFGTAKSEEKTNMQLQFLEEILLKSKGAPIDIQQDCRTLTTGVIASILFSGGSTWADPDSVALTEWVDSWYMAFNDFWIVGNWAFNIFPEASLLPWLLTRRSYSKLMALHVRFVTFIAGLMKSHKDGITEREAEDVTDAYLKDRGADDATINLLANTILVFLPDAIDTAATMDMWCLLYTTLNPDIQKRLHAEVDRVCGEDRISTLADRPNMHYTQAVIHEVLRITLLTPLSLAREMHRDVSLDGYNIPRGAQVVGNFYAVHFDPEIFPNPTEFDPSRFIDADGKFNTALGGRLLPFGIGPRKCIAEMYFKVHMFLFLTRILQRFSIGFDPNEPKPTSESDTTFLVTRPMGFKVCFKER